MLFILAAHVLTVCVSLCRSPSRMLGKSGKGSGTGTNINRSESYRERVSQKVSVNGVVVVTRFEPRPRFGPGAAWRLAAVCLWHLLALWHFCPPPLPSGPPCR